MLKRIIVHFCQLTHKVKKMSIKMPMGEFWRQKPSMSAQFLQRDAMHKRGLCRHAVSVCLSRS